MTGIAEAGAQALARHFEQTEARQPADLDAGAIHLHGITQAVFHRSLILGVLHVDEIDNDQTADIANAQLPGNFVGSFQVGIGRGGFDIRAARGARRIDVDRYQRFGVVDHQAAARRQLHFVRVGRFDLIFDLIAREQRNVVGVGLQLALRVRRHKALHVFLRFLVRVGIVHQHFAEVVAEIVAQRARDRVAFLVDEIGRVAPGTRYGDCIPLGTQIVQIPLQLFGRAADAGGANDGAHALRDIELVHDFAHLIAVFAFDTARDATGTWAIGHQHQKPASQTDERGQRGAFGAAFFLFHLHQQFLTFAHQVANIAASTLGGAFEVFLGNFL